MCVLYRSFQNEVFLHNTDFYHSYDTISHLNNLYFNRKIHPNINHVDHILSSSVRLPKNLIM